MFHPTREEKLPLLDLIHKMQNLGCMPKQELFLILFMSKNGFKSREEYEELIESMQTLLEIHSDFCNTVKESFPTMARKELYKIVSASNEEAVGEEAYQNGLDHAFGFVFERDDYKEIENEYEEQEK